MRVSEDRYLRDLRRINLAQRLILMEVRTQWICALSGLTGERVRNLYNSYAGTMRLKRRRRGPSPKKTLSFVRSSLLLSEASALAGLAYRMEIIPAQPVKKPERLLRGVEMGERLCDTFELYRELIPGSTFCMEHFIALVLELAEGATVQLGRCEVCQGALLLDRLGSGRKRCPACRQTPQEPVLPAGSREAKEVKEPPSGHQQSLF